MCLNVLNFSLRTSSLLVLTLSLRRRARKHFKCTVRTDISHLTAHMCESMFYGGMCNVRQVMAEKSARYDALQRGHHCRAAGSARSVDLRLSMRYRESTNDCGRPSSTWSA